MDRPLASVVSAFSCVPRVSAVSAANSSATPRMLFTRLGSMNTATASVGRDNSAVFGSPAAVRDRGLTYSRFMEGLKAANIDLDRKVLADLAVSDEKAFDAIFAQAKKAIEAKDGAALRA